MSLRVELWLDGVLADGLEEWWDRVEAAIDSAPGNFPLLASISPYGQARIPHGRLADLADECRRLQPSAIGSAGALLLRIADLSDQGFATSDAELRFEGD